MKSNTGRGLKDLLVENHLNIDDIGEDEIVSNISLSNIEPNPYQPRKIFDEEKIAELASSINENGVFQPIIVKQFGDKYIIVSGERRFRACKMLNLETMPAIVRGYDEARVAEIALIENLQREDLTPMEEASAYANIMNTLNLTQAELAKKIGKSRSHITNMLGLLSLPDEVSFLVSKGKISMGHARALSKLKEEKRKVELANEIVKKNLSVRDIEEISKNEKKTKEIKVNSNKYARYEKKISSLLNCNVKITEQRMTIKASDDVIAEIIKKLLG